MITLKDFKYDAKWMQLEFADFQLRDIYNAIDTDSFHHGDDVEIEFEGNQDFTIFFDRSITALLDNLSDFKGQEQTVVDRINNQYGNVIEFYHLSGTGMYCMAVGAR